MAGAVEVDCTVAVLGPLAGCAQDAVLLYSALMDAQQRRACPCPLQLPRPLPGLQEARAGGVLAGTRGCVYWPVGAEPWP